MNNLEDAFQQIVSKESLNLQNEDRCNHVMLWTNGRVMDWLRSVDLAEYAPNLRGSGVHGALMVSMQN